MATRCVVLGLAAGLVTGEDPSGQSCRIRRVGCRTKGIYRLASILLRRSTPFRRTPRPIGAAGNPVATVAVGLGLRVGRAIVPMMRPAR